MKKTKRMLLILCAAILLTAFGATMALAASTPTPSTPPATETTPSQGVFAEVGPRSCQPGEIPQLTDEEKAAMEEKRAEMRAQMEALNEKWSALTDAQKEEYYAIQDKAIDAKLELIDKYLSQGLIDEQTAAAMKEKLNAEKARIREDGRMPWMGGRGKCGKGGRMRCGMGDGMPPAPPANTTTTPQA